MSFTGPMATSAYVENMLRLVPGAQALHRMAVLLLAEKVPGTGHVLVLGAGGGVELKAFADARPGWRLLGVDPSADMLDLAAHTLGPAAGRVEWVHGHIDAAPDGPFDGATCLLTLHFLSAEERLHTLAELRRRLRPGAPLVIAHHSVPAEVEEKRLWFRRSAAFGAANGLDAAGAEARVEALIERLPVLDPEAEEALLQRAGFKRPQLFYAAFSFRGWVAYA